MSNRNSQPQRLPKIVFDDPRHSSDTSTIHSGSQMTDTSTIHTQQPTRRTLIKFIHFVCSGTVSLMYLIMYS